MNGCRDIIINFIHRKFDLLVLKMVAICHLGFLEFQIFSSRFWDGHWPTYITVANLFKIGLAVLDISHLMDFKMAAIRHFGFLKVEFLNGLLKVRSPMCVTVQNFVKISQQFWWYRKFSILKMAAFLHLGFQNFSRRSVWDGEYASSHQISSKSVIWLLI